MGAPAAIHETTATPETQARPRAWLHVVQAYIALTKPRIIELLLITTLPAMILAARGWPGWKLVIATLVGGYLAAGGAGAINCYIDRDIDSLMARTRKRPLVTGAVTPRRALTFGIALGVLAFAEMTLFVNLLSAALSIAAFVFYVFVYTLLLKRSTPQNIVIGGAAGAMPPVIGWAAVTGHLSWAALIMFAIIFIWTPPHFWALALRFKDDYERAHVPMLPVVRGEGVTLRQILFYTALLVVCSFLLLPTGAVGVVYGAAAAILGGLFLWKAWRLERAPGPRAAMTLFRYSTSYLALLFLAMAVDQALQSLAGRLW
jgi:protoheme IX farnesyltransferase